MRLGHLVNDFVHDAACVFQQRNLAANSAVLRFDALEIVAEGSEEGLVHEAKRLGLAVRAHVLVGERARAAGPCGNPLLRDPFTLVVSCLSAFPSAPSVASPASTTASKKSF